MIRKRFDQSMKCETSPEACTHDDLIRVLMDFCAKKKKKTVTYSTHFSFVSTRKMTIIMWKNITKISDPGIDSN